MCVSLLSLVLGCIRLIRLVSKSSNTAASSPSQLSTVLHRRRRRRQATLSSLVNASTAYSTPPVYVTSSHSVSHNLTTISPLSLITSSISNETHLNATAVPYFNNTTTTSTTAKPNRGKTNSALLCGVSIMVSCYSPCIYLLNLISSK